MREDAGHAGYCGLAAELYDLVRGDSPLPNELRFYRLWLERHPGPALEVACGTGRVLLKLLARGFEVDGLDASADMLRLCREKAQKLGSMPIRYRQRMQQLDIARSYQTIFVPLASFMLVTDTGAARHVLQRFFAHLQPGGHLLFSTYYPTRPAVSRADWVPHGEIFHPAHGLVRVSVASEVDERARIFTCRHRFETGRDGRPGETVTHSFDLRWYESDEMTSLLEEAGFRRVQIWGNHTEREASPDDAVLVFSAMRPAAATPLLAK